MRPETTTREPGQPERASALKTYLDAIRRRKLTVIVCMLVGIAIGVGLSVRENDEYAATSAVVLSRINLASNAVTGTVDPTGYVGDFLRIVQTQANVARSPEVAKKVVTKVPEAGYTVDGFLAHSGVAPKRDADILEFTATHPDPEIAKKLATVYAQSFVEYRRFLDSSAIASAREQLAARIRRLRDDPQQ